MASMLFHVCQYQSFAYSGHASWAHGIHVSHHQSPPRLHWIRYDTAIGSQPLYSLSEMVSHQPIFILNLLHRSCSSHCQMWDILDDIPHSTRTVLNRVTLIQGCGPGYGLRVDITISLSKSLHYNSFLRWSSASGRTGTNAHTQNADTITPASFSRVTTQQ